MGENGCIDNEVAAPSLELVEKQAEVGSQATKARDALGAALILESGALRAGLNRKQLKEIKNKAKDALGLALLNEAEDLGMEVTMSDLQSAKERAREVFEELAMSNFT